MSQLFKKERSNYNGKWCAGIFSCMTKPLRIGQASREFVRCYTETKTPLPHYSKDNDLYEAINFKQTSIEQT